MAALNVQVLLDVLRKSPPEAEVCIHRVISIEKRREEREGDPWQGMKNCNAESSFSGELHLFLSKSEMTMMLIALEMRERFKRAVCFPFWA